VAPAFRLASWDGVYYITLATRGYQCDQNYAFYPGYPALLRLLPWSPVVNGLLLSGVAHVLALRWIALLVQDVSWGISR
jgi:hypothetical protein